MVEIRGLRKVAGKGLTFLAQWADPESHRAAAAGGPSVYRGNPAPYTYGGPSPYTAPIPPMAQAGVLEYEYIVVGSGAGGGPLACRLARAGHKTLLIEAGDDQNGNPNITVPGLQGLATQDDKLRWDFFVNHYQDQGRAQEDFKYTWEVGPYKYHVAMDGKVNSPPPANAKPLGILYPRAGTLGGGVTQSGLVFINPHASDWNGIAAIVNDNSWHASNMEQYLDRINEWLPVKPADKTLFAGKNSKILRHLTGGAKAFAQRSTKKLESMGGAFAIMSRAWNENLNSRRNAQRDSREGLFQVPLAQSEGSRIGVRSLIASTIADGYPLTVRTNCFVTKITFDKTGDTPKATGVEFLDGRQLYRASPLSGGRGVQGSATATKETIISAGAFNTPQLLKLSGLGPQEELNKFRIPLIKHLPGVGTNLQDHYEIPVTVKHQSEKDSDFNILSDCTFDGMPHDKCLDKFYKNQHMLGLKGVYASNVAALAAFALQSTPIKSDIDLFISGGPMNFRGYFPQWADDYGKDHKHFTWSTRKVHTRNRAGTVHLSSEDPLDRPIINFNYFDTGNITQREDYDDLNAMVHAIRFSRKALKEYYAVGALDGDRFIEELPGKHVQSDGEIIAYIQKNAWGTHASCSAPIGAAHDPMAVLDSNFRVRGVQSLRVVDASVFPRIPGISLQSAILMVSEKAADVILNRA